MKAVITYNIIALLVAIIAVFVILKVRQSSLKKSYRMAISITSVVLIIGLCGYALFLDAIMLGIIGLVPN